jgi:hypothetical protein
MAEPDVTLTDYGLALECAFFLHLLSSRMASGPLRWWFLTLFGSLGLAALAGGTVHGFFHEPASTGLRILWPSTLLAVGVTALAAWAIGAHMMFPVQVARWVIITAVIGFIGYSALVLFVSQAFLIAALNYLPAVGFMFVAFSLQWRHTGERSLVLGLVGLGLTVIAAGLREARLAIHPVYFDHNALYHILQALALLLIFLSARALPPIPSLHVRIQC